jgi:hypothetical protein
LTRLSTATHRKGQVFLYPKSQRQVPLILDGNYINDVWSLERHITLVAALNSLNPRIP